MKHLLFINLMFIVITTAAQENSPVVIGGAMGLYSQRIHEYNANSEKDTSYMAAALSFSMHIAYEKELWFIELDGNYPAIGTLSLGGKLKISDLVNVQGMAGYSAGTYTGLNIGVRVQILNGYASASLLNRVMLYQIGVRCPLPKFN